MKKANPMKFSLIMLMIVTVCSCKKEQKVDTSDKKNRNIIRKDTVSTKPVTTIKKEETTVYTEIRDVKKIRNYGEGPVQSLDVRFKDREFRIRYIQERAYIQYAVNGRIIQDWQFCNTNFYYDSSYEIAEEGSYLLYNEMISSGILLFPSFTEEYAAFFVYEFDNGKLQYIKDVILEQGLSADVWSNTYTFRAVRKKDKIQISLIDKKGKEYMFQDREEYPEEEEYKKANLSADLKLLNEK